MQIKTGRDDRLTNVAIIRKTNNIASFGSGMVPNGLCVKKLGSRVALLGDCRLWEVASYGDLPISWRMPLKGSWRTRIGFFVVFFFLCSSSSWPRSEWIWSTMCWHAVSPLDPKQQDSSSTNWSLYSHAPEYPFPLCKGVLPQCALQPCDSNSKVLRWVGHRATRTCLLLLSTMILENKLLISFFFCCW